MVRMHRGTQWGKKILLIEPGELVRAAEELRDIMAASGTFYERGVPVCIAKHGSKPPFASALTKNSIVVAADKLCRPMKEGERKQPCRTALPNFIWI